MLTVTKKDSHFFNINILRQLVRWIDSMETEIERMSRCFASRRVTSRHIMLRHTPHVTSRHTRRVTSRGSIF